MIKKRRLALFVFGGLFGGLCHCVPPPDFDLQEPVYLVLSNDFDEKSEENAHRGIWLWARHWEGMDKQLDIRVVKSRRDAAGPNPPIFLALDPGIGNDRDAEYEWGDDKAKIKFKNAHLTAGLLAHELGHALWTVHHINHRPSILNSTRDPCGNRRGPLGWPPLPLDVIDLCKANPEIECPDVSWCQGIFYDTDFCPSASPEEIEQNVCSYADSNND